jgi:hypothetical protein
MPILTIIPMLTILVMGVLIASLVVLYLFVRELQDWNDDEEDM